MVIELSLCIAEPIDHPEGVTQVRSDSNSSAFVVSLIVKGFALNVDLWGLTIKRTLNGAVVKRTTTVIICV